MHACSRAVLLSIEISLYDSCCCSCLPYVVQSGLCNWNERESASFLVVVATIFYDRTSFSHRSGT